MTPAERALLLAVAKAVSNYPRTDMTNLWVIIAAVEAEAAFTADDEAELAEVAAKATALYEVPPTVCPTCEGHGSISMGNGMYPDCTDCNGTGKKEKTDEA